jgi:hypothetical protein
MFISETYVILSPAQLIISLLLTLADRQHVSALFKSLSSGLPVENHYIKITTPLGFHWCVILV